MAKKCRLKYHVDYRVVGTKTLLYDILKLHTQHDGNQKWWFKSCLKYKFRMVGYG